MLLTLTPGGPLLTVVTLHSVNEALLASAHTHDECLATGLSHTLPVPRHCMVTGHTGFPGIAVGHFAIIFSRKKKPVAAKPEDEMGCASSTTSDSKSKASTREEDDVFDVSFMAVDVCVCVCVCVCVHACLST